MSTVSPLCFTWNLSFLYTLSLLQECSYYLIKLNPCSLHHVHTQRLKFFLLPHWSLGWYFERPSFHLPSWNLVFGCQYFPPAVFYACGTCGKHDHWFLPNFLEACANTSGDPPPLPLAGLLSSRIINPPLLETGKGFPAVRKWKES